jgi:hypothetical protein
MTAVVFCAERQRPIKHKDNRNMVLLNVFGDIDLFIAKQE